MAQTPQQVAEMDQLAAAASVALYNVVAAARVDLDRVGDDATQVIIALCRELADLELSEVAGLAAVAIVDLARGLARTGRDSG